MPKRILYPNGNGGVAIIIPSVEAYDTIGIEQIARKDVPIDTPYIIVNTETIPADRTFRNAWEADFSNPDGYGIGQEAWFLEQVNKDI